MGRDVIGLDLSCSELQGTIHSNSSLFLLPNLQQLNLAFNCFNSPISSGFGQFAKLEKLDLSSSQFSGQVPHELSKLSKLSSLDLSGNKQVSLNTSVMRRLVQNLIKLRELRLDGVQMSLVLLDSLMNLSSSLTVLSLNGCGLHGNLPYNIFRLPNLRELSLICNLELRGAFPTTNWSNPLMFLDVSTTGFSGPLPNSIDNLKFLKHLGLSQCNFNGLIPASFGNLTQITELDLSGNNFVGSIPESFGNLRKVTYCYLSSNSFIGHIPSSLSNLKDLTFLDLGGNNFEGLKAIKTVNENEVSLKYIGEDYYQDSVMVVWKGQERMLERILTIFTTIDLSCNKFHGQIPKVLGKLQFLRELNLSHNSLTSYIPSSLGNLLLLESLDLSSNMLNGSIPMQLTSLTFLAVLNLSQNKLIGPIPQGLQFNTFQNNSYIGNKGLCGFPLSKKCRIVEPPSSEEDNDLKFTSGFGWKAVMMGYGCGFVYGIAMGYLVSKSRKPQWLHSYPKMESWKKGTDYCSWDGVTCDRVKGNLIGFDLSCSWLQGTIPPNSTLFLLSHLQYLNLAFNDFDFSLISSGFGQFTRLRYLNLSGCVFSGQVPLRLSHLSLLTSLYLSQNHFVSLETFVVRRLAKNLKMLRELHLDLVDMSSVSLSNLTQLTDLDLSDNHFSGEIPSSLSNLKMLLYLGLEYNNLNGSIPSSIGNLTKVPQIFLRSNYFTGQIPSLSELKDLNLIDLRFNNLRDRIPNFLTNLTRLTKVYLSYNQLTSQIDEFQKLDISSNDLSGIVEFD
ncbi:receptor-like protein 9DC1 [Quercus robur]|uniref:receptor-like protein 9DC1 n=1 Tax=Quercus robur TaxID=38942 RepID=UPI0021626B43|nr:receptor-like protein 9DC1 [Quercus robur]